MSLEDARRAAQSAVREYNRWADSQGIEHPRVGWRQWHVLVALASRDPEPMTMEQLSRLVALKDWRFSGVSIIQSLMRAQMVYDVDRPTATWAASNSRLRLADHAWGARMDARARAKLSASL